MTAIIARLIALGCPPALAKPLMVAVAALALLGAVAGIKGCYDRRVVSHHNAKVEAATAKADRKADSHAAETRIADQARANAESTQISEALHEAGTDPIARRRAYYDCVRKFQSARANQSPATC
ncbi:MAG: hypothetical protein H0W71_09360 [Sphingomonas sp.]|nr:hypothetical protein [Sphingomonas sp.]